MMETVEIKSEVLNEIPIDYSWSFSDKTQKDTNYITHGYYTYPAKFIPQLASRLIYEYSSIGDFVLDPMMGSGTTVVESIVNGRAGFGSDINEIAVLVAKAKAKPLNTSKLKKLTMQLQADCLGMGELFSAHEKKAEKIIPENERIDYWFKPEQKGQLGTLLFYILKINDEDTRRFFLVAFAQILKTASIWMQKSIKPTRDKNKTAANAFKLFFRQVKKMLKKNEEYNLILPQNIKENFSNFANIEISDSRNLPLQDETIDLIVTSPPYVTSYEYADLHQLPLLWLGHLKSLPEFRKKFIGSSFRERDEINLKSTLAGNIVSQLKNKKAQEVKNYYADMLETFSEMHRVLKPKGRACIVIGNTQFNGVDILNAEVFLEQMQAIGFKKHKVIHREIPSKMLPSTRDAKTGRFTKATKADSLVYPTEYILVMEKL
ncbi:MAG: DNA methyltransferase [Treponemataceae bacterium]